MKANRRKLELAMARACMNSADLPSAAGLPRPTVQNVIVGKGVRPGTVAQIRHMAKTIPGVQCVVVDYLGKVTPADKRASRYESVTDISGALKTLAVELGVTVLALAQLNRENTGRADKRPQLSDLRDSGAIEQDADGVIMLHREDYYEMAEASMAANESVELEIIVRKNRHGRIGNCRAGFFPAIGKIVKIR